MLRKLILIACIASIGSLFASSAVGAQGDSTRNSTVSAFDVESTEPEQFQISLQVEDDAGSSLSDQNYALGMLLPLTSPGSDQRTTVFVGLETLDGGRWATLVVNYEDPALFDAGSFEIAPDAGLVPFVDSVDNERRIARSFDWGSGDSFDFVLTRTVGTAGTLWSAEMVTGGSVLSLGSQLLPVDVGASTGTVYSVVQRTNFSSGCSDASYLRARLGAVSSVEDGVASPAFLSGGWVEPGSCPGSSVSVAGADAVIHELGGLQGFLDGALGTDTELFGDYIVGLAQNPAYPSCLANIVDGGFRRVCFAEPAGQSPSNRDLSIGAIVDSPSRPPGETIWIGRFDEEVGGAMSKRFLLQNTAIAAIIALVATVMSVSPVAGQVGETVGGVASDDAAFAEPGEAVDIDVVANDGGMDEFDEAPALIVVDQPDGGFLSTAFDEDGIAVLLFSANVTFSGVTTGKYRACWGNSCDNAEVTVYVGGEACTIAGTNGPDTLVGTSGDDVICGLSGADTIDGKGGADLIFGGNGRDTLRGSGGADEIYGGRGDDTIIGGNGADRLFGRKGADTISGNGGADEIHGNRGRDVISGGNGNDELFGGRGQDTITGGDGEDVIRGRRGDDDLRGNADADEIFGGRGADSIRGNGGDDVLNGGNGTDTLNGGNGSDECTRGETVTNCENDPVEPGTDTDGDGIPDDVDPDDDNDGVLDDEDAFPLDPTETTDTDGDGTGDNADADDDGDGIPDSEDPFPLDPTNPDDLDGDGIPDSEDPDIDGDGIPNEDDAFPLDGGETTDTDGDGIGDNLDEDADNDGVLDVDDDFPLDADEDFDTDGDGIGDNADPDADNDGVLNEDDQFPFDDTETVDSDGGGLGDVADLDDDGDFVLDENDAFPEDPLEWADTDGDGIGDNADADDDGDGIPDVDDDLPLDGDSSADSDGDGIGDETDPDDDNDGVPDVDDAFPTDPSVFGDADGDGQPDRFDQDSDGDGIDNLQDDFPLDADRDSDQDLDGVDDAVDADDDGDGVPDAQDAFPLNPAESVDADGNGVGDNRDAERDSDGDGTPDTQDDDRDGDLVPDAEDAFPDDVNESVDSDGDGVGDIADTDADDDGVPDALDLMPLDASIGTDTDGDGTPDSNDLDPNSAEESRFQVAASSAANNSSVVIVSDSLILANEIAVVEEAIGAEDPLAQVAASPVVDFTIEGPVTAFESARITIPIEPALADTGEVEVWWLDESIGLWVRDGVDLEVDPVADTVSVTVDHFSKFVALRSNVSPRVAPPAGENCVSSLGTSVVILIDDSGSNEFSYIVDGVLQDAGDPRPILELTRRDQAARKVVLGLNQDNDRFALMSFAGATQAVEFGSWPSIVDLSTALNGIFAEPSGGTDVTTALSEAAGLFSPLENREKAIVLITDGDYDLPANLQTLVPNDVAIHTVSVTPGGEGTTRPISDANGGVYVPFETAEDSAFDSLRSRFAEAGVSDQVDTDGDLISDCRELLGTPVLEGIDWVEDGDNVNEHKPEFWVVTNPNDPDTDGDFLWDSEELIPLDLTSRADLRRDYADVISAGFPTIYSRQRDPVDRNDPVNDLGVFTTNRFGRVALSAQLVVSKQTFIDQADVRYDAIQLTTADPSDIAERRVELQDAVIETTAAQLLLAGARLSKEEIASRVVSDLITAFSDKGWEPPNPSGDFDEIAAARLEALLSPTSNPLNPNARLLAREISDIEYVERLQAEIEDPATDPLTRLGNRRQQDEVLENLMKQFYVSAGARGSVEDQVSSNVRLIRSLVQRNATNAEGFRRTFGYRGAYRQVKLFETGDFAANQWLVELQDALDWDEETAGPRRTAVQLGITEDDFIQLVLEVTVARSEQIRLWRDLNGTTTEFFSNPDDLEAVEFLVENFFERGKAGRFAKGFGCVDGLVGICAFRADGWSVLYSEFRELANEPGALSAGALERLPIIWDDIAMSQDSSDAWAASFIEEDFGPIELTGRQYVTEYWRETIPGAPDDNPDWDGADWIDEERIPGLITINDLQRITLITELFQLFSEQADEIDVAWSFLFIENDTLDQERGLDDLEAYIANNNLPEAVASELRTAIRYGLFDDTLTFDEVVGLFEVIGTTLSLATLSVVTGGGSVGLLALAAAAAEGTAVTLRAVNGEYQEAAIGAVFLVFDAFELGSAAQAAIRSGRLAERLQPLTGLVARARRAPTTPATARDEVIDAIDHAIKRARKLAQDDNVPVDAQLIERLESNKAAWELRPLSVTTSASENAAYAEAVTFDALVVEAKRTGGDLTDAQARELVEQTLATGRSGLNEAEIVRVRSYLESNTDDGPALFASKGTAVIDDPVAAGRYADLCLNSFAGDTLVVLADGSRVPIVDVSVGDRVAAFDVVSGLVVDRPVTAVLSHDDVLFDVSLSDGSMLSMTSDHSVFEVSSQSWMPIAEFDADDLLLGLSGATLTVTGFDETSGANTTAWDLSVGSAHNFFVAGDHDAVPVLVHNASDFCALPITLAQFDTLASIADPVEAAAIENLLNRFGPEVTGLTAERYESIVQTFVRFADSNADDAIRLASDSSDWVVAAANGTSEFFTRALTRRASGAAEDLYYRAVLSDDLFGVSEQARVQGLSLSRVDELIAEAADPPADPRFVVTDAEGRPSKGRRDSSFTRTDDFNGNPANALPNVLMPNQSYVRNGYEYITDGLGRPVEARANVLKFETLTTGTNSYTTDIGNLGGALYEGGHLIGRRFGGFVEGVTLSPQLQTVNQGAYKAMEDGWARLIDPIVGGVPGMITNVRVQAIYDPGNSTIVPDRFVVTWLENGNAPLPRVFQNR